MTTLIARTELRFQRGSSDKVYIVEIFQDSRGCFVHGRYGRRGASLCVARKNEGFITVDAAQTVAQRIIDEKLRKGYQSHTPFTQVSVETPDVHQSTAGRSGTANLLQMLRLAKPATSDSPLL